MDQHLDQHSDQHSDQHRSEGSPGGLLKWGAGLGVAMVMVTIAMSQPVPHQLSSPPAVALGRLTLIVALAAVIGVYVAAMIRIPRRAGTTAEFAVILGVAGLLALLPALAPHSFSTDVNSYVMYGRVAAVHGQNPMLVPPSAVGPDPYLALVEPHYRDTISVYGPVWNAVSAGLTWWAESLGGSPGLYAGLYRLLCLAGFLAAAALLWSLLGRLRPNAQLPGTVAFAWSPVLLLETSAVHNDTVMLALMAGGLLAISKRSRALGFSLLALAALVKWVAVIPLILLTAHLLGRAARLGDRAARVRDATQTLWALLPVPLIALVSASLFSSPLRSLAAPFSSASDGVVNSAAELLEVALGSRSAALVEGGAKVLILAAMLLGLVLAWRADELTRALGISCAVMLAVVLAAPRLWPWYVMWPLMLAPFAACAFPARALGRFVGILCLALGCTTPLLYALYPVPGHLSALTAARLVIVVMPALIVAWFLAPNTGQQAPTAQAPAAQAPAAQALPRAAADTKEIWR